jgi:hypothetical protein
MKNVGSRSHSALMCGLEIAYSKRDLRPAGCGSILGFVQREVHEGTIGPTRRGVTATGPRIVASVIVDVKVEAEGRAVEHHRPIQI